MLRFQLTAGRNDFFALIDDHATQAQVIEYTLKLRQRPFPFSFLGDFESHRSIDPLHCQTLPNVMEPWVNGELGNKYDSKVQFQSDIVQGMRFASVISLLESIE